jgi:hypothetical protein
MALNLAELWRTVECRDVAVAVVVRLSLSVRRYSSALMSRRMSAALSASMARWWHQRSRYSAAPRAFAKVAATVWVHPFRVR